MVDERRSSEKHQAVNTDTYKLILLIVSKKKLAGKTDFFTSTRQFHYFFSPHCLFPSIIYSLWKRFGRAESMLL